MESGTGGVFYGSGSDSCLFWEGLGKMTRTYHDLYRNHLIRSPYLHRERPILINNWEATYFEFDDKKLLDIAREASNSELRCW